MTQRALSISPHKSELDAANAALNDQAARLAAAEAAADELAAAHTAATEDQARLER
jgi:hypothetical protein